MEKFKSTPSIRLNIILYVVIIILSISGLSLLAGMINTVFINPGNLTEISPDRPVRITKDVYLTLKADVINGDKDLSIKVHRNIVIFKNGFMIIYIGLIISVLLQLNILISSLKEKTFFESQNIKCVRNISYLLTTWVWIDIILYLSVPLFISHSIILGGNNYSPLTGRLPDISLGIISLFNSINKGVLLSAFAFYVLSVILNEGNRLKEEADLTI